MRVAAKLIPVACVCLLGLQLTGLHMHVEAGIGGHAHGAHVYPQGIDGDDHDGEQDVASVTLGAPAAKLLLFLVAFVLPALSLAGATQRVPLPVEIAPRKSGRTHWRPPLRAPPHSA